MVLVEEMIIASAEEALVHVQSLAESIARLASVDVYILSHEVSLKLPQLLIVCLRCYRDWNG